MVQRQAEGAANGTINRELAALKRAFSLAMKAVAPDPDDDAMLREGSAKLAAYLEGEAS